MQHSNEKIVKNTLIFTFAGIIQKGLSFANFWFVSSHLPPGVLGVFVWALSYSTLFSVGTDLGLATILSREAAKDHTESEKYLRTVYGIKIPFVIITSVILWVAYFFTAQDFQTTVLVLGANLVIILDAFTVSAYAVLRARQNVKFEGLAGVIAETLVLVINIVLLSISKNVYFLIVSLLTAILFNFIYSNAILKLKFGFKLAPKIDRETAKHFMKIAPSFALSGIFARIYTSADSVLLGLLSTKAAVGLYSIPAKVTTALQALIPATFIATIYPSMSNYWVTSREKLKELFSKSTAYIFMLSIPITFGLFVLAPNILNIIWPNYIEATGAFRVMVWGLPFVFACFPSGSLLNACDLQKKNMLNRGIITAVNILVNIALIPILGATGAAIAFVAANVVLFILDFWFSRRVVKYDVVYLLGIVVKSGIASLVMAFLLHYLRTELNLVLLVAIGAVVYFASLALFGAISKQEILAIKNLLIKKEVSPEKAAALYEEKPIDHP